MLHGNLKAKVMITSGAIYKNIQGISIYQLTLDTHTQREERERERLTVPATDLDDIKVFALNLDNPKSHT